MKHANRWMRGCGAAFVAAATLSMATVASAAETVRFGKAVGSALSFTVVDGRPQPRRSRRRPAPW